MNLFTVQLELGPETRAMIEKVAASSTLNFELGPRTLETMKSLLSTDSKKKDGLLRKSADAVRK